MIDRDDTFELYDLRVEVVATDGIALRRALEPVGAGSRQGRP